MRPRPFQPRAQRRIALLLRPPLGERRVTGVLPARALPARALRAERKLCFLVRHADVPFCHRDRPELRVPPASSFTNTARSRASPREIRAITVPIRVPPLGRFHGKPDSLNKKTSVRGYEL